MNIEDSYNSIVQSEKPNIEDTYNKLQSEVPPESPEVKTEQPLDSHKLFMENPFESKPNEPGFLKKVEMISSGAMEGSLQFTGGLLSLAEKGLRLGGKPTVVPDAMTYWQDKNKQNSEEYGSKLPETGKLLGEMLTTSPVSVPLGIVAKGAQTLGKLAPEGLKTIAKYGASGLGGAGVLAGMESQRFDPSKPDQVVNLDATKEALQNPLSYAIPMAGTKLETWMGASRALGEAKESIPNIMARDLKEGTSRKVAQTVFDALPALTGIGKRVIQMGSIGEDLSNFVSKLAGTSKAMDSIDLVDYAGKQMKGALNILKHKENLMWEKGFKTKPITNVQDVKDEVINAMDMLKGSSVPSAADTIKSLQEKLRKQNMTVDDVKQIQSLIGKSSVNARFADKAGALMEKADSLQGIKDNLLNKIQDSLSPEDMKDFSAAREFSARNYELMKVSPKIKKAIETEVSARKLIRDLISEKEVTDKKIGLSILPERGQNAASAAKLAQIIEQSDVDGKFNIGTFLDKTKERGTQVPRILGSDKYKALDGFRKYLASMNEASEIGGLKQAAVLAASGAGGALTGGAVGAALPLISYGAAQFVANHSPLKSLLHAATKDLPSSTYGQISKAIGKHLTRAGYLFNTNGELTHKNEDTDNE